VIDECGSEALLPPVEHVIDVQVVETIPVRCHLCEHRDARHWGTQDDLYLPLSALWERPCPRCSDWLLNENGVLIAGLVVFKGRYASVHMRG
jgi:hypothetical protein